MALSIETFVNIAQKALAGTAIIAGGWWFVVKFWWREEHFPRIGFEISANFVGVQGGKVITEIVAKIQNKGLVPLKIKDFEFWIRALLDQDPVINGDEKIRNQVMFPHLVAKGTFVPASAEFTFIQPDVDTEYNYVCSLPPNASFIRIEGSFLYYKAGSFHRAARILAVPKFPLTNSQQDRS